MEPIQSTDVILGEFRITEVYGHITLSIVGGEYFYSIPKATMSSLDNYSDIEVGILTNDSLVQPSEADPALSEYDDYFSDGVAGYMPVVAVKSLRNKLHVMYNTDTSQTPNATVAVEGVPEVTTLELCSPI